MLGFTVVCVCVALRNYTHAMHLIKDAARCYGGRRDRRCVGVMKRRVTDRLQALRRCTDSEQLKTIIRLFLGNGKYCK